MRAYRIGKFMNIPISKINNLFDLLVSTLCNRTHKKEIGKHPTS